MSSASPSRIIAPLREAAVDAAWTQWSAIGSGAVAKRQATAIVDPEALVLASLALGEHEPRLHRVMQFWLGAGSRLLSVGRLTNLMRAYPPGMAAHVRGFAAEARAAGDARWARLAGRATAERPAETGKEPSSPDLRQPSTIILRLRLAMGVGIKADALTLLIGGAGAGLTVREVAGLTGYHERAVRRAIEDLVAARLVQMLATSPVRFLVRWKDWAPLIGVDEDHAPLWRCWHELYVSAVALDAWARRAEEASWSPYVAASRLRDAFEALEPILVRGYVREQPPDWSRPPEAWLDEMEGWVGRLVERLRALV